MMSSPEGEKRHSTLTRSLLWMLQIHTRLQEEHVGVGAELQFWFTTNYTIHNDETARTLNSLWVFINCITSSPIERFTIIVINYIYVS